MSDPLKKFEALVWTARAEIPPHGDVSASALRLIRERSFASSYARPLTFCASAYGLVCVAGLAAAYWYATRDPDPMMNFFAMATDIAP